MGIDDWTNGEIGDAVYNTAGRLISRAANSEGHSRKPFLAQNGKWRFNPF
jgi:hypothetical protein